MHLIHPVSFQYTDSILHHVCHHHVCLSILIFHVHPSSMRSSSSSNIECLHGILSLFLFSPLTSTAFTTVVSSNERNQGHSLLVLNLKFKLYASVLKKTNMSTHQIICVGLMVSDPELFYAHGRKVFPDTRMLLVSFVSMKNKQEAKMENFLLT